MKTILLEDLPKELIAPASKELNDGKEIFLKNNAICLNEDEVDFSTDYIICQDIQHQVLLVQLWDLNTKALELFRKLDFEQGSALKDFEIFYESLESLGFLDQVLYRFEYKNVMDSKTQRGTLIMELPKNKSDLVALNFSIEMEPNPFPVKAQDFFGLKNDIAMACDELSSFWGKCLTEIAVSLDLGSLRDFVEGEETKALE